MPPRLREARPEPRRSLQGLRRCYMLVLLQIRGRGWPKLGPPAMECPYALEDPYQRPLEVRAPCKQPWPRLLSASRSLRRPRARQPKQGAPCPGSTAVKKKRAQAPMMASLTVAEDGGRGPAHYQLDYDDEERPGMRGMSSGMD